MQRRCVFLSRKKKKRAPNTGLYKVVLTSQGLWLGHDIKVENSSYSSGFLQVRGSKHPQAPQTRLSQPASHQAPSLQGWAREPNAAADTRGTGLPLSLVSSSGRGLGCQTRPSANLPPRPCQSCRSKTGFPKYQNLSGLERLEGRGGFLAGHAMSQVPLLGSVVP